MTFYSSIYIGKYFIFLPLASTYNPVSLKFRDQTSKLKSTGENKNKSKYWHKKIFLYPEILQRKWIEYSYRDRFIPSVKYDNISPIKIYIQPYINIGKKFEIKLKSIDYFYRKMRLFIKNNRGDIVFSKEFKNIKSNKVYTFELSIGKVGIYEIGLYFEDTEYIKKTFFIYKNIFQISIVDDLLNFTKEKDFNLIYIYCERCTGIYNFLKPTIKDKYLYKSYIPFNDLIDNESYNSDYINGFIMAIHNPSDYKRGLIHLLNMIRLSKSDNEMKIMTNLFKDDPAFAYFVTNRLFLFDMIPLISNSELQNILRLIDDLILARALYKENKDIISKIFNNVSKRRVKSIKELWQSLETNGLKNTKNQQINRNIRYENEDILSDAKNEVNKTVKSYFLLKYGRVLKIPISKRLLYKELYFQNLEEVINIIKIQNFNDIITLHSGRLIIFNGINLAIFDKINNHKECFSFDYEYYGEYIFDISAIDESSIYLKSHMKIRFGKIHIYDWKSNLENIEIIESIETYHIIPLQYPSEINILTIGIIDNKSRPHEQVIRIIIED